MQRASTSLVSFTPPLSSKLIHTESRQGVHKESTREHRFSCLCVRRVKYCKQFGHAVTDVCYPASRHEDSGAIEKEGQIGENNICSNSATRHFPISSQCNQLKAPLNNLPYGHGPNPCTCSFHIPNMDRTVIAGFTFADLGLLVS